MIVRYLILADNRSLKGLSTLIRRYLIHGTITLNDLHFRVEVQHYFCIPGEKFLSFTVRTFIFPYSSLNLIEREVFKKTLPAANANPLKQVSRTYHRIDDWAYLLNIEAKTKK